MKKKILLLLMTVLLSVSFVSSSVYAKDVEVITDKSEKVEYNNKRTEYLAGNEEKEDKLAKDTKKSSANKNKTIASKKSTSANSNRIRIAPRLDYTPKTSDNSYVECSMALMVISILGMSFIVIYNKKRKSI